MDETRKNTRKNPFQSIHVEKFEGARREHVGEYFDGNVERNKEKNVERNKSLKQQIFKVIFRFVHLISSEFLNNFCYYRILKIIVHMISTRERGCLRNQLSRSLHKHALKFGQTTKYMLNILLISTNFG